MSSHRSGPDPRYAAAIALLLGAAALQGLYLRSDYDPWVFLAGVLLGCAVPVVLGLAVEDRRRRRRARAAAADERLREYGRSAREQPAATAAAEEADPWEGVVPRVAPRPSRQAQTPTERLRALGDPLYADTSTRRLVDNPR